MGGGSFEPDSRADSGADRGPGARRAEPARATGVGAGATETGAANAAVQDLQDLLAGAVQRLARATGVDRVAAWALRPDGSPYVAASAFRADSPPPREADATAMDAIFGREGASDFGLPPLAPALSTLALQQGFAAAAPLHSQSGEPLAVLLLGGDDEPVGEVRARSLAELDAAVRRLRSPATTAAAIQRLSRLDGEVQRLDRLAALGDLLGEAVHELRNPLVSFKTFVELSGERATDPEFQTEFRTLVAEELRRMERLLDELLRQASPLASSANSSEPGVAGPAGVADALESLRQLLEQRSRQRGVTLEVQALDELPDVAVARDALRQVLLNLTLNALDATPAGGTVVLSAERVGDHVEFCIDDEGVGVPHDQRDHIFQPFVSSRTDRPGGLGLAISRKLVDEAGGWIRVDDAPNAGARFRVSLPTEPKRETS